MKLYWKIILLALLPLSLALGLGFFRLEAILRFQRANQEKAEHLKTALLSSRFESFRQERQKYASILGGANDAARAAEAKDTGFLLRWGKLFLDPLHPSRIFFTDMNGTVLARAHDAHRFGDSLKGSPALASALRGERVEGIFNVEGEMLSLSALPVKLYGEIPTGVVLVGTELTSEYLARLLEGTGLGMELKMEGFPLLAAGDREGRRIDFPPSSSKDSFPGSLKTEKATLFIPEDPLTSNLLLFQRNLGLAMFLLFTLLISGFFLLLRRYLRPFSLLVEDVTLLSGNQEDFSRLRIKLVRDYRYVNHEVAVIAQALSKLMERLQETILLLEWTSRTDPLTHISNRLHLDSLLTGEMARVRREKKPLSVLIFDLDHFKEVNDDFGHQAGDEVLRRTAEILKIFVPRGYVGRWGGEEFLAILPEVSAPEALEFGERARKAMEREPLPISRVVTISAGVAEMSGEDSPDSLVARADKALYEAKSTGRNRVVFGEA